jgi:hypothetical protein
MGDRFRTPTWYYSGAHGSLYKGHYWNFTNFSCRMSLLVSGWGTRPPLLPEVLSIPTMLVAYSLTHELARIDFTPYACIWDKFQSRLGAPAILTEGVHGECRSTPRLATWFLPNPFKFIVHSFRPTIRRYTVQILKSAVNPGRQSTVATTQMR